MKRILLATAIFLVHGICFAGAWGPGSFENDDALDWIAQCTASKGAGVVATTLQAALASATIDASDGAMAIVAAEVVAAAKGRPGKDLPQTMRDWIARQPKTEIAGLAPLASNALARIKQRQLWDESDSRSWTAAMGELEGRLR